MMARIQLPASVKRGEAVEVRVAIRHPMETGFRYDVMGKPIAKNVINRLVCRYNGEEVFRAEMGSGIAANPYLQFYTVAQESGELEFFWEDDSGAQGSERARLEVTA